MKLPLGTLLFLHVIAGVLENCPPLLLNNGSIHARKLITNVCREELKTTYGAEGPIDH
jgi:hypothetical protein